MRIAFFTEAFDPYTNGVVVLVKAYRDALEAAGHEVVVFAPEHENRPTVERRVVRMASVQVAKEWYRLAIPFSKALRHFDDLDFDIIHSHHPFSCGLLAEKLSRKFEIPLVYTFHTLLTQQSHHVPGPKQLAEQTIMRVIRRHCTRSHCVTVSTRVMQQWLRKRAVKSPVQIVRPNVPAIQATAEGRRRIRGKFGFAEHEIVAFCASRLSQEKDLEILLRATSLVPRELPLRVLVAGDGPEEKDLKKLAKKLRLGNRIVWGGAAPHAQIGDWYAAGDFFAFPSRNDTLGMVVLEAMASGLPCIVANENGPAEIVRPNVDGLSVHADPVSFSHAMSMLTRHADLRQAMGQATAEGVRLFCTPDTATGLLDAYATAQDMLRLDRMLGKRRGFTRSKRNPSGPQVY